MNGRTAADQAAGGTKISLSEAQAGDLIYYDNGSGVYHIAIYNGDGTVTHSSNSVSGVKISDMNYSGNAAGAVRYWWKTMIINILVLIIVLLSIFGLSFLINSGVIWILCWISSAIGGREFVTFSWPLVFICTIITFLFNCFFLTRNKNVDF